MEKSVEFLDFEILSAIKNAKPTQKQWHPPSFKKTTMYRCPPVLSPILAARERIKQDAYMKRRLANVGKSVDNTCPKSYASGWNRRPNPKKKQLDNDRKALIQQDNRLLLERISDIMQHNNLEQHAGTRKYTDRMSNIGGRRAQLKKINQNNKQILKRLDKTTAYYDNRIAAKDWKMYRGHLEHMGTFAYKGGGRMNGSVQKILARAGKGMSKRSPNSRKKVVKRASTASGTRRRSKPNKKEELNPSGPLSKSVRHSMSAGGMTSGMGTDYDQGVLSKQVKEPKTKVKKVKKKRH